MISTKSIIFNGTDEYINCGNVASFQKDRTDAFSISCWAKTTATSAINTLVAKISSSGNKSG